MMSASPPVYNQRLHNALEVLAKCKQDPFSGELKQVNEDLVTMLDPFVGQCLTCSSVEGKAIKGNKCYEYDKGRFVGLSVRARTQQRSGILELSLREQITILFIMSLYRLEKEGRSSESSSVADPVETCGGNDQVDYNSPQSFTPDSFTNHYEDMTSQNLVDKIWSKIRAIKDNLGKYFTVEDAGNDTFLYKNTAIKANIDYTNEDEFIKLISRMTVKTRPAGEGKCHQVKPKNRSGFTKRRTTISQTPANLNIAPHLASAGNHQSFSEPAIANDVNVPSYQEYPTPSYNNNILMAPCPTADFTSERNFYQIPSMDQNMLAIANQGENGAYALFREAPNGDHLYLCITKLLELYQQKTGRSYADVHQEQQLSLQARVLYYMMPNTNGLVVGQQQQGDPILDQQVSDVFQDYEPTSSG